jgi:hypothetical protein
VNTRGLDDTHTGGVAVAERICSILDCGRPHLARSWCSRHYQFWQQHGHPLPPTTSSLAGEQWRPVVGYEGWYEVSDHGRVRRVAGGSGALPGRVLIPQKAGADYRKVNLYRDGQKQQVGVHLVVAAAFIGPRPPNHECNHKDGNKTNNHLGNLEYVTSLENSRHASRIGLLRTGELHQNAKLTAAQVAEIRQLYQPWTYSTHRLAREFGVCAQTIYNIVHGRIWVNQGGAS